MTELERPPYIWFDGAVRPWADAQVHVWTETVLRAASIFEGLRGYWHPAEQRHYFLHVDAHMKRMAESARVLRIPRTVSVAECVDALHQLLRAMPYREDVYIRPTVYLEKGKYTTGGVPSDCGFFMPVFPSAREESIGIGLTCEVSSWRRSDDTTMPPRVKAAANYYNLRLARLEATTHGYGEAILLNPAGKVAETGGASVFIVRDRSVATPSLGSSILDSITRRSAIQLLTESFDTQVEERDVDRTELYLADEVFLTGTLCEVTPVTGIDGIPVGNGKPGPLTRRLQDAYYAACQAGRDDQRQWLTPGPVLDAWTTTLQLPKE